MTMTSKDTLGVPTVFATEPSSHLKCLLCKSVYTDPVINVTCGHTFCRKCAINAPGKTCPSDNSSIDTNQLVINRLVVGQIEDLPIYCRHGLVQKEGAWEKLPGSCTTLVSLGAREEHESSCLFFPLPCPNSEQCGTLRKRDIERHKLECVRTPCQYKNYGCNYRGTPAQVSIHSKACLHREGEKLTTGTLIKAIQAQEGLIKSLQTENQALHQRVSGLEGDRDQMADRLEKQNSLIVGLTQRVDNLTAKFDGLFAKNSIKRTSMGSQLSLADSGVTPSIITSTQSSVLSSPSRASTPRSYENWDMPFQFKCMGTYRGHKDIVWSMTTKKGRLYSGGAEGLVKVWSLEQLAKGCIDNMKAHNGVIHCMATWGSLLLTGSDDLNIRFWDLNSYEMTNEIKTAHDKSVCAMVVSGDTLFSSSFSSVKVWDLKSLEIKAHFTSMNHWVRALALGHNKDKLYSSSHNAIHVWDIKDKYDKLATIEHTNGSVYALAVNRLYIVAGTSGSYEENIQVYNVENHERIINLCGHIGTVTTLVISPSGRFMFSASHDCNIQIWSLEKLLPIQSLSRHQGSVNTLTLHGDFLLSGSEDREIKVFRYFQIQ